MLLPAQNIGRISSSCGSVDAMNKRKSSRIAGVLFILFGFMPLLNSLSNPRLASAHGADRLQLIAVGLCFGIGACLLAGRFRFRVSDRSLGLASVVITFPRPMLHRHPPKS